MASQDKVPHEIPVDHDVPHERPYEICICGWNRRKEENAAKAYADIENRFAFHAATTEEKRMEHGSVREQFRDMGHFINSKLPEGREKSTALTKLEEAMFWANAAIARNK